jgi:hypothetical protein
VIGFPILGVSLLVAVASLSNLFGFAAPYGLSDAWLWFIGFSPVASLVLLYVRRASLPVALGGLLLNILVSVPVTYLSLIVIWAKMLCEPGAHDMCLR